MTDLFNTALPQAPKSSGSHLLQQCFDRFWQAWPRKVAKQDAYKSYLRALKKASPDEIYRAAILYAEQKRGTDTEFIVHASTWLNGERWKDEIVAPKPPSAPGPRQVFQPEPPVDPAVQARVGSLLAELAAQLRAKDEERRQRDLRSVREAAQRARERTEALIANAGAKTHQRASLSEWKASPQLQAVVKEWRRHDEWRSK